MELIPMVHMAIRPRHINAIPDAGLGVPVSFGGWEEKVVLKVSVYFRHLTPLSHQEIRLGPR